MAELPKDDPLVSSAFLFSLRVNTPPLAANASSGFGL